MMSVAVQLARILDLAFWSEVKHVLGHTAFKSSIFSRGTVSLQKFSLAVDTIIRSGCWKTCQHPGIIKNLPFSSDS